MIKKQKTLLLFLSLGAVNQVYCMASSWKKLIAPFSATVAWYGASQLKAVKCEEQSKKQQENRKNLISTKSCRACFFSGANLSGADLRDAYLRDAILTGADLRNANLGFADLSRSNLNSANLGFANLSGADLSYAYLERTNLNGASLRGANLIGADLERADFSGADLSGARLKDADLSGANLSDADLRGAIGLKETKGLNTAIYKRCSLARPSEINKAGKTYNELADLLEVGKTVCQ